MFGKSSAKVNQWLEKKSRRRPQSAYYPSSMSSKLQISSENQDESCRNGHHGHSPGTNSGTLARRAFSLQQPSSASNNRLGASPTSNERDSLSIPTRHTSKFYKLDPELQARVDNALESDQVKQLMQRLQQQKKTQRQSQPPPAVPPHYVC